MLLCRLGLLVSVLLLAVSRPAVATAGDGPEDVPLDKVPAVVKKAAEKAAPGIIWDEATKETDGKLVVYTLTGENAKMRSVSVEVTAAGKVREVSTEIPLDEVPKAVAAALAKRFPRFKADDVYEVKKGGKVVEYHFDGRRPADTDDVSITVSADGKTVEIDAE